LSQPPAKKTAETKDVVKYDYGQFQGQGYEGQSNEDVMIPLLNLLQPLSPEVQENDPKYVKDAKPGMMMNSVTGALYKELVFTPVMTQHRFVEWVPRAAGGGFRGVRPPDDPVVTAARAAATEFGKYMVPTEPGKTGNELKETFYVYAVTDDLGFIVIPFSSTKIKVYKRFNTSLRMFTLVDAEGNEMKPPLFAHRLKLTTRSEENQKGKYYNFVVEPLRGSIMESLQRPGDPMFQAAIECRKMVEAGTAQAAYHTESETSDDNVPF